jgi:hypothetical protein
MSKLPDSLTLDTLADNPENAIANGKEDEGAEQELERDMSYNSGLWPTERVEQSHRFDCLPAMRNVFTTRFVTR